MVYALSLDGVTHRYVGFTTLGALVRLEAHYNNAVRGRVGAVYDWIRKYIALGVPIQTVAIEECEKSQLSEREQFWIKELRTHVSEGGLNLTTGGSGVVGRLCSDEERAAMSVRQKEYFSNPKNRAAMAEKIRALMADPANRDRIREWHTPERRAEQSARIAEINRRRKGTPKSATWRAKQAARYADPEQSVALGAAIAASWTPERRRRQTELMHVRWHVNRGLIKDSCVFCTM